MEISGNVGNLTPAVSKTPEPMVTKCGLGDEVRDPLSQCKFHYDPPRGFCSLPPPRLCACDLLLEFWDPLHIWGTVVARNFKFRLTTSCTNENKKLIRRWDSERELSLRRHCTRTCLLYTSDAADE